MSWERCVPQQLADLMAHENHKAQKKEPKSHHR